MMAELLGAVLMAALGTYYFRHKKTDRRKALFCKALATSVPAFLLLFCLYAAYTGESGGGKDLSAAAMTATLAALVFYMAADVLLECVFVRGALCFSMGHICMAAGLLLSGESVLDYVPGEGFTADLGLCGQAAGAFLIFTAAAGAVLGRYIPSLKKKKLFSPLLAYLIVLNVTAAFAVAAGIRIYAESGSAVRSLIPAAGGVCFVISDILLGKNRLSKRRSAVRGAAVLILYYTAVYLFAMRLWL